jgi:preprotein translocase subunit SecE
MPTSPDKSTSADLADDPKSRQAEASKSSAFRLYKAGQGYWTRLGTAIGAGAIVCLLAFFLYEQSALFTTKRNVQLGIAGGFVLLMALVVWFFMNKANRAQFLIDTDSEMKKVNWSSWPDLVGSTKVVVLFMLATAVALFVFDTQFHALFYGINVWKVKFDAIAGLATGAILGVSLLVIGFLLFRGEDTLGKRAGLVVMAIAILVTAAWVVLWIMKLLPAQLDAVAPPAA